MARRIYMLELIPPGMKPPSGNNVPTTSFLGSDYNITEEPGHGYLIQRKQNHQNKSICAFYAAIRGVHYIDDDEPVKVAPEPEKKRPSPPLA